MTALMVLALTVPPSVAAIMWRLVAFFEAQARKLNEKDTQRLRLAEEVLDSHGTRMDMGVTRFEGLEAELKRLNDQLSLLADRYR